MSLTINDDNHRKRDAEFAIKQSLQNQQKIVRHNEMARLAFHQQILGTWIKHRAGRFQ